MQRLETEADDQREVPAVSVVVAARHGGCEVSSGGRLGECLHAIAEEIARRPQPGNVECLVVHAGSGGTIDRRLAAPGTRWLRGRDDDLVPHLWARGILASRGELVALTIGDCVPLPGWLDAITNAPWQEIAGLGGTFELDEPCTSDDRAIFFLRYSAFAAPLERRWAGDLAGDNAAYRRGAIMGVRRSWADGFWEPQVHAALLQRGEKLLLEPAMRVRFRHSGSTLSMVRQRFVHGRWYATHRMRARSVPARALRALTAPALPFVLLARIWNRTPRRGGAMRKLLGALPRLAAYSTSWSAGEMAGYMAPFAPETAIDDPRDDDR